jgi:hypothetical protein
VLRPISEQWLAFLSEHFFDVVDEINVVRTRGSTLSRSFEPAVGKRSVRWDVIEHASCIRH